MLSYLSVYTSADSIIFRVSSDRSITCTRKARGICQVKVRHSVTIIRLQYVAHDEPGNSWNIFDYWFNRQAVAAHSLSYIKRREEVASRKPNEHISNPLSRTAINTSVPVGTTNLRIKLRARQTIFCGHTQRPPLRGLALQD